MPPFEVISLADYVCGVLYLAWAKTLFAPKGGTFAVELRSQTER